MAEFSSGAAPHLLLDRDPPTGVPVLVAAFEGWNDAGEAATSAVRHLEDLWDAEPFARLDPEEYYDFSNTRPQVRFGDTGRREIVWPANTFSHAEPTDLDHGVVTLLGIEPQLRWRSFCGHVLAVADAIGAGIVVTLGALLAEVPHSRPVPVFGTAYDEQVVEELGLVPSRYEGPTGIVGALHGACNDAGLQSASLWAAVPTYLPAAASPKATLALVDKLAEVLDVPIPRTALEIASANYERQVDEAVGDDEDTAAYIASLEERFDSSGATWEAEPTIADEVEEFLREQGP